MGHWVGQKADPTAREQVDGKCRCVCYKGDCTTTAYTQQAWAIQSTSTCMPGRRDSLEALLPTKLYVSALLIHTHPLTGPQATLGPKGPQF